MSSIIRILPLQVTLCIALAVWTCPFPAHAQSGSWLDTPQRTWNVTGTKIPKPPKPTSTPAQLERCMQEGRPATTAADRILVNSGWRLFGPLLVFGKTSVIRAMADVDGMCRPMNYQVFVFVSDQFAGTVSPSLMNSRTDGSMTEIHLLSASRLVAEFARYTPADPLCCPSRTQSVPFAVERGLVTQVREEERKSPVNATADESTTPAEGIVTGTVEYKERVSLLPDARLMIRIVDTAGRGGSPIVISEEKFGAVGNVPISFTLRYSRGRIDPHHTYRLQALLRSGDNVWENAGEVSVITNGESAGVRVMLKKLK